MSYEEKYNQEVQLFNNISKRFDNLQENDIENAYRLMRDSLQAYNRWSSIKYDIKKEISRGEGAAVKSRLEEICKYLKEVHTSSRMVWSRAKDDYKNSEGV